MEVLKLPNLLARYFTYLVLKFYLMIQWGVGVSIFVLELAKPVSESLDLSKGS